LNGFKKALRHFIAAQHEHTQEFFKKNGITHVVVARGMWVVGPDEHTVSKIKLQPASSFSTSVEVAKHFAGHSGSLLLARVPVSQVLGTHRSGFGCTNEHEVVLLNHPKTQVVHVKSSEVTSINDFIDNAK
jgi:hypothetical protein